MASGTWEPTTLSSAGRALRYGYLTAKGMGDRSRCATLMVAGFMMVFGRVGDGKAVYQRRKGYFG